MVASLRSLRTAYVLGVMKVSETAVIITLIIVLKVSSSDRTKRCYDRNHETLFPAINSGTRQGSQLPSEFDDKATSFHYKRALSQDGSSTVKLNGPDVNDEVVGTSRQTAGEDAGPQRPRTRCGDRIKLTEEERKRRHKEHQRTYYQKKKSTENGRAQVKKWKERASKKQGEKNRQRDLASGQQLRTYKKTGAARAEETRRRSERIRGGRGRRKSKNTAQRQTDDTQPPRPSLHRALPILERGANNEPGIDHNPHSGSHLQPGIELDAQEGTRGYGTNPTRIPQLPAFGKGRRLPRVGRTTTAPRFWLRKAPSGPKDSHTSSGTQTKAFGALAIQEAGRTPYREPSTPTFLPSRGVTPSRHSTSHGAGLPDTPRTPTRLSDMFTNPLGSYAGVHVGPQEEAATRWLLAGGSPALSVAEANAKNWKIRDILAEKGDSYLVDWADHPRTREKYYPSWVSTPVLWRRRKRCCGVRAPAPCGRTKILGESLSCSRYEKVMPTKRR